jgi:hypothetical protein
MSHDGCNSSKEIAKAIAVMLRKVWNKEYFVALSAIHSL